MSVGTSVRRLEAPCIKGCPAGVDIPRYVGYLQRGRLGDALAVVRERLPIPAICGRVCYHPCQPLCRRVRMDGEVSICAIKRAAADYGGNEWRQHWAETIAPASGKRVAIIGSGPAGLTAAYYLGKRRGHQVTVFEALSQPGGQLRVGIPPYRLPREVLEQELAVIRETRVDLKMNTPVQDLDGLLRDGYDAVLLATGAMKPRSLGAPGQDLPGVMDCTEFLRDINLGQDVRIGPRVVVVGGGNVAVDGARVALRQGGKDVRILYRRTRQEMPAHDFEVAEAEKEGVKVEFLMAPKAVSAGSKGLQLQLIRMQLGEPDASGRRRPVPIPGSEFTMEVDTVLVAIGQEPHIVASWGLAASGGNVQVDPNTLQTSKQGVFACGDAVTGPASVIEAVAAGRKVAEAIDRYLGGSGDISEHLVTDSDVVMSFPERMWPEGTKPFQKGELPAEQRLQGFQEIELGLTAEDAVAEAQRCLRCDLWRLCGVPAVWPKKERTTQSTA